jgi:hypothetical protein
LTVCCGRQINEQRDTERYREIQKDTERYREIQKYTERYRKIQTDTDRYREMHRHAETCRETKGDPNMEIRTDREIKRGMEEETER